MSVVGVIGFELPVQYGRIGLVNASAEAIGFGIVLILLSILVFLTFYLIGRSSERTVPRGALLEERPLSTQFVKSFTL